MVVMWVVQNRPDKTKMAGKVLRGVEKFRNSKSQKDSSFGNN